MNLRFAPFLMIEVANVCLRTCGVTFLITPDSFAIFLTRRWIEVGSYLLVFLLKKSASLSVLTNTLDFMYFSIESAHSSLKEQPISVHKGIETVIQVIPYSATI